MQTVKIKDILTLEIFLYAFFKVFSACSKRVSTTIITKKHAPYFL